MKYSKIILLGVLGILVLGTMATVSVGGMKEREFGDKRGLAHAPIHINGNADFASQAASEGWAGDGSQANPYIIEGYEIDSNGGSYCIWIENTTVYFVVRNCSLYNATDVSNPPYGHGISLYNVSNGKVEGNEVHSNSYGITLDYSTNNTIANNNAFGNTNDGIFLGQSSNYNIITNNVANRNNDAGIFLAYSSNNTITNNSAHNNRWHGINLDYSNNNTLASNNVSGNDDGIHLYYSSHNNIMSNGVQDNSYGISVEFSDHNTIANNTAIGNINDGIYIGPSSNYNIIADNVANDNGDAGIFLAYSSNNEVTNNMAKGNQWHGINLDYSSNNNLTSNNVQNSRHGIHVFSSNNNILTKNNASHNSYGIYLESARYNIINYNWMCYNPGYGAYVTSSSTTNTIQHNFFIGNKGVSKGVSGYSQAYDSVGGNYWYDAGAKEGNYWSNWDGNGWGTPNAYPIAGGAGASDWYPLSAYPSEISVTITLEKTFIDGRKDARINGTVRVTNGTTPMPGINVTLKAVPSTNIQVTPLTDTTDANGTVNFTITLTADFTTDVTLSIVPDATINGVNYTGVPAALTIKGVAYNVTLLLEVSQIDGRKGNGVNATVKVMCNTEPLTGVNVSLTLTPDTNLQVTPAIATTDANGTAQFRILLTDDFTNNTTVSIEPKATINGVNYTGASAILNINGVPRAYEITLTLEKTEIEGKKDNTLKATIIVKANGVGVPNLTATVTFNTTGLIANFAPTAQNGSAVVTITIAQDFASDVVVKVTPKVEGIEYPEKAANLRVKAKVTYEVSLVLEKTEVEGKKDNTLKATITVKAGGMGVANVSVTLAFDKPGLSASTETTANDGTAVVTITLVQDFASDTVVRVTPSVAGTEYPSAAQSLTVKAKAPPSQTPGFEFLAVIGAIAIATFFACQRSKKR